MKSSIGQPSPSSKEHAAIKYKKAPEAPRRFKSSYMFFSTTKHKQIREELDEAGKGNKVRTLSKPERFGNFLDSGAFLTSTMHLLGVSPL